ncbi:sensor histidine kinase KdpD [Nitrosopumilus sp.]|uniref:sensor histidine kinase n=1 Tax=Nitrosopumilus sp. TaxID=2024843 RepID=UPI0026239333|nr:HAMP domain-containing sensor histidine kinase [Nitrosopumilus sp.]
MIILLLGTVSTYTILTMNEMNHTLQYNSDYSKQITNFEEIKSKYESQILIFKSLNIEDTSSEIGNFWIYNTEIKNNYFTLKNFIIDDSKTLEFLPTSSFSTLEQQIFSFYELHLIYENTAAKTLDLYYTDNTAFMIELENLENQNLRLINKIHQIEKILQTIPISSQFSTTSLMDDFQIFQWVLISLVGIITFMLIFFLNRSNQNLKNEIKKQTSSLSILNQKLQNMDKKRSEFISIASHELKGPIQPIFGFVELSKSGIISKDEAIDGIDNVARNLENIANNVLDLTKIENDELELNIEKHSVHKIINEIVNSVRFNPSLKVPINTRFDEDVELNLDKTRIKQVLRNILDNCIKFTNSGEILIQTYLLKEDKIFKITITDTGPEIPNDVLPNIFGKFVTKTSNNVSGFGLGLYISKKIIDCHNGKITASNHIGQPVFEISLPLLSFKENQIIKQLDSIKETVNLELD